MITVDLQSVIHDALKHPLKQREYVDLLFHCLPSDIFFDVLNQLDGKYTKHHPIYTEVQYRVLFQYLTEEIFDERRPHPTKGH